MYVLEQIEPARSLDGLKYMGFGIRFLFKIKIVTLTHDADFSFILFLPSETLKNTRESTEETNVLSLKNRVLYTTDVRKLLDSERITVYYVETFVHHWRVRAFKVIKRKKKRLSELCKTYTYVYVYYA